MRALGTGRSNKDVMAGHGNYRKRRGFTLIELLVVISIISLLAAILFPVFARARENARKASCLSNIRQIGLGMMQYSQDYDERLPRMSICGGPMLESGVASPSSTASACTEPDQRVHLWMHVIYPYVKSAGVFNCPSASITDYSQPFDGSYEQMINYGYNFYLNMDDSGNQVGRNLASIPQAGNTVMIAESSNYRTDPDSKCIPGHINTTFPELDWCTTTGANTGDAPLARHFDRTNVAYVDGHAKSVLRRSIVTNKIYSGSSSVSVVNSFKADPVWRMWCPRFQD